MAKAYAASESVTRRLSRRARVVPAQQPSDLQVTRMGREVRPTLRVYLPRDNGVFARILVFLVLSATVTFSEMSPAVTLPLRTLTFLLAVNL